jgi:hypothetical protein
MYRKISGSWKRHRKQRRLMCSAVDQILKINDIFHSVPSKKFLVDSKRFMQRQSANMSILYIKFVCIDIQTMLRCIALVSILNSSFSYFFSFLSCKFVTIILCLDFSSHSWKYQKSCLTRQIIFIFIKKHGISSILCNTGCRSLVVVLSLSKR